MPHADHSSRRLFLGGATAALAGGLRRRAHAETASTPLRIGLVGCGGRGTGAATNALRADQGTRLVAVGDAFADRIGLALDALGKTEGVGDRVDVPPERRFTGFDAFQKVIAADVDVVLLATPPHFRPQHIRAAIAAGKHVFAEKPVAVDAAGVQSVTESLAEARRKKLSLVSGFCWRYDAHTRELIRRVHAGAIGEIKHVFVDDLRGAIWVKPRQPGWSDMEYQMRNWYYFNWLSGDFNVEQHVHLLDLVAWALKGKYPVRAHGVGGRTWRTSAEHGNIFDHHAVTYDYDGGLKVVSHCRQFPPGSHNETYVQLVGTKGTATWVEKRSTIVTGKRTWQPTAENDKFQVEHDELFASIRKGKPIHDEFAAASSFMGVIGRMATYTGQAVSWDAALTGGQRLGPDRYAWGPLPVAPVAVPGRSGT